MKWRVSTATPQLGVYWLGVAGKPELIGVSMLPCAETRLGLQRAEAIAEAMARFDLHHTILDDWPEP